MKTMQRILVWLPLASLFLAVPAVEAQEPPEDDGQASAPAVSETAHRHLGLFVRADLALGYLRSGEWSPGFTAFISGWSATGGVSVGGAVAENLILAAHVIDAHVTDADYTATAGRVGGHVADSALLLGVGPELTYYLQPSNVYFSGTAAITRYRTANAIDSYWTSWGYGLRAAVGKEWWVGDHVGLGLVGHVTFSSNDDPASMRSPTLTLTTWAAGIGLSATYN